MVGSGEGGERSLKYDGLGMQKDFHVTEQDSVLTEYKGREPFWMLRSAFPFCFVREFQAGYFLMIFCLNLPSAGLNTGLGLLFGFLPSRVAFSPSCFL